jgi:nucleoside-diphosphate-sugar epimerase
VLGATGHIGQAVIRHALGLGREVTAVTRQQDPLALRGLGVDVVRVEDSLGALNHIAAGHDLIVDAAAPYPLDPCVAGSDAFRGAIGRSEIHAQQVIAAARRHSLRLVFLSSFTTLPRAQASARAWETAWRRSTYPYFAAKAAMEQMVLDAARRGLPVLVINPAACLGPWEYRNEGSSFVRLVLGRRLPMVMDQWLSVIDVRDVAETIDRCLEREFFGRPIALAGHNVNLVELARQILQLDGAPGLAPWPLNAGFASIAAFWTSAAFAAVNQETPDLWRAVPLIADAFPMDPSPEQIAIGLTLRPLVATLCDAVDFHQGIGRGN